MSKTALADPKDARFLNHRDYARAFVAVLGDISTKVPLMRQRVRLGGTAPIAALHTAHRQSWDADFTTTEIGSNPSDVFDALQKAYGKNLAVVTEDRENGMYQAILSLKGFPALPIDLFTGLDRVPVEQIETHPSLKGLCSVGVYGYMDNKVESLTDGNRRDSKDIYDLAALHAIPGYQKRLRAQMGLRCDSKCLNRVIVDADKLDLNEFHAEGPGFKPVTGTVMQDFVATLTALRERKITTENARREHLRNETALSSGAPGLA